MRMDANHAAITISGRDKATLTLSDIMAIDMDGNAVGTSARPSAETLLHVQMYRRDPQIGAVLHTHSHNQTVASRLYAQAVAMARTWRPTLYTKISRVQNIYIPLSIYKNAFGSLYLISCAAFTMPACHRNAVNFITITVLPLRYIV